jgi:hypothetical protein
LWRQHQGHPDWLHNLIETSRCRWCSRFCELKSGFPPPSFFPVAIGPHVFWYACAGCALAGVLLWPDLTGAEPQTKIPFKNRETGRRG